MNSRSILSLFGLTALTFLVPENSYSVDFKEDVQPIFKKKCYKCHSGPRAKGKLRYDDEEKLASRIGTGEDAVFVPGDPVKSLAIIKASLPRTDTDAMPPPNRGDALNSTELGILKKWIMEGAKLESGDDAGSDSPTSTEPAADMNKMYDWTNTEGNTLKAGFVSSDGKSVVLKKEDGSEFTYPMSKLNLDSRAQAKKLATGG